MADSPDPEGPTAEADEPAIGWIVVSGEWVVVGNEVTVDLGEPVLAVIDDVDAALGLPLVRVREGATADEVMVMTPGQIMGLAAERRKGGARRSRH